MPGNANVGRDTHRGRFTLLIPLTVVALFFCYLWWVSGVVQSVHRYPSGRKMEVGNVRRHGLSDYRRTGRWMTYHENGEKASEGEYIDGRKAGEWLYWDESGKAIPPPAENTGDE